MRSLLITISFFILSVWLVNAQTTVVLETSYLPVNDSILIYKPVNYSPKKNYPLIILLHGYSGDYKTWSKYTPLQDYADKYGFIIVCPDGLYDSWYINSPTNESVQYESFFFMRLLPYLFRHYAVDKKNIFITGLSMGGYGALYLYASHPELFKSAGSTSGLIAPEEFKEHYGIEKVMGMHTKEFSLINFLNRLKKNKHKFIIDCGTEDPFLSQNKDFKKQLEANKIEVNFITSPGRHHREYWKKSILEHFKHFYTLINK